MISFPVYTALAAPLAAAAVVLVPMSAATAEPAGPLIETTCSYEQLDAALRIEAPQVADRLAQNPTAQQRVRDFLALPVDQRRDRVQDVLARNPDWQQKIDEKRGTPEGQQKIDTMNRIATTCPGY
ncbi:hemophore-related protein [Mycolicibacterium arenosum]|uniref:Hemophore-related protein n=1 Tax=Mycolicibacterium arenosum TaxID=2952157 RepID=A0ABT1MBJ7_9MYCO|nr:hemophore-related protein [Mycolicibacterium sp. CAU 1645]MCP9275910.1 hemophore-related protein [Mycolicibacterium sp. CAU 1645]